MLLIKADFSKVTPSIEEVQNVKVNFSDRNRYCDWDVCLQEEAKEQ